MKSFVRLSSTFLLVALGVAACGGAPGAPESVVSSSEPIAAGAVCPFGGTAVHIGRDQNGNGALDGAEIERTSNVCNADTPPTLTRVDVEPAGPHCGSGGRAVRSGPDANHNGTLDDAEIASTIYACDTPDLIDGDVTADMWKDPATVERLAHARVITGSLVIRSDQPVSLPKLAYVGGMVEVVPGAVETSIDAPALAQVGGDLVLDQPKALAGAIALPSLTRVGGSVHVAQADVDAVTAPTLAAIGGSLSFAATGVAKIDLPSLAQVGGTLSLTGLDGVTEVALPALTQIGAGLDVGGVSALPGLALPALRTIGGEVAVTGDAALAAFELVALERIGGNLYLSELPGLHRVGLPALTSLGADAADGTGSSISGTGLSELALPALTAMPRRLDAGHNPELVALKLPALPVVDSLVLFDDDKLGVLDLSAAASIGELRLSATPSIVAPASSAVTGQLELTGPAITQMPAIRIGESAAVLVDRAAITDLRGLVSDGVIGGLSLQNDDALTSLAGLETVGAFRSGLYIERCGALTSLAGLDHVAGVGGSITLDYNDALTNLDALGALSIIGGDLTILHDAKLSSIAGLDRVGSIGVAFAHTPAQAIHASDVPALPASAVTDLIARLSH